MKVVLKGIFLILTLSVPVWSAQQGKGGAVYVEANTPDTVGTRLAYQLREQLRSSRGLQLAGTEADSFMQINLVTLDPDNNNGLRTIYSAVITAHQLGNPTARIYLTNIVGACGGNRVTWCVDSLAADIDEWSTTIQYELLKMLRDSKK